MLLAMDQQYRAAAEAPGAAAAVNVEQHQHKAPSPGVSSSRSKAAAVITGRCYYRSNYHTGTWYVPRSTDHSTAVKSHEYVCKALFPVM